MPAPEYLGPYKIGDLIGRGGMGNVYRGQHVRSGEVVAVKLIAPHVSDDPRFRRRFDKEIRAMKLLKHPGIVRIIGEGEDDYGQLFYSMELIEGETLQTRIRRLHKIDWRAAIEIAIQICAALKHAHDIGVTHRDLKPANLIMTADETVKLVDFGIPKNYFDDAEETLPVSVLGTPDYMAPEQATGGPITPRTDLYSLGSVLYAMLVGRAPFKGKNSTEVILALRNDRPVPLDMIDASLPESLVDLVHQLLEKEPDQRPPTALAVMNRLKAILKELRQQQTLVSEDPVDPSEGDGSGIADTSLTDPSEGKAPGTAIASDPTSRRENTNTAVADGRTRTPGQIADPDKGGEATVVSEAGDTGRDKGDHNKASKSDRPRASILPPVPANPRFQTIEDAGLPQTHGSYHPH